MFASTCCATPYASTSALPGAGVCLGRHGRQAANGPHLNHVHQLLVEVSKLVPSELIIWVAGWYLICWEFDADPATMQLGLTAWQAVELLHREQLMAPTGAPASPDQRRPRRLKQDLSRWTHTCSLHGPCRDSSRCPWDQTACHPGSPVPVKPPDAGWQALLANDIIDVVEKEEVQSWNDSLQVVQG